MCCHLVSVFVYSYMDMYININMYIHIWICISIYEYVYSHMDIHVHMWICIFICSTHTSTEYSGLKTKKLVHHVTVPNCNHLLLKKWSGDQSYILAKYIFLVVLLELILTRSKSVQVMRLETWLRAGEAAQQLRAITILAEGSVPSACMEAHKNL